MCQILKILQEGSKPDLEKLRAALVRGERPSKDAYLALRHSQYASDILMVFSEYESLPNGMSLETAHFCLYAAGNHYVPATSITNQNIDLNQQWPGLLSPISFFTQNGQVDMVQKLIDAGVRERPLRMCGSTHNEQGFTLYDLSDIDSYRKRIVGLLSNQDPFSQNPCANLKNRATISQIFLYNPTPELEQEIAAYTESDLSSLLNILIEFCILNKDDEAKVMELFSNTPFPKLLTINAKHRNTVCIAAAAFNSYYFLQHAIEHDLLTDDDIYQILETLAAEGNLNTLERVVLCLPSDKQSSPSIFNDDLLFWPTKKEHSKIVMFLIRHGMNAKPFVENEVKSAYLLVATYFGDLKIMELLLEAGVNPTQKNKSGETALSIARKTGNDSALKLLFSYIAESQSVTDLEPAISIPDSDKRFSHIKLNGGSIYIGKSLLSAINPENLGISAKHCVMQNAGIDHSIFVIPNRIPGIYDELV